MPFGERGRLDRIRRRPADGILLPKLACLCSRVIAPRYLLPRRAARFHSNTNQLKPRAGIVTGKSI